MPRQINCFCLQKGRASCQDAKMNKIMMIKMTMRNVNFFLGKTKEENLQCYTFFHIRILLMLGYRSSFEP